MNFVPESPRWLLASERVERREEARGIMKRAAEINGLVDAETDEKLDSLIHKYHDQRGAGTEDSEIIKRMKKKQGFLDIFK